MHDRVLTNVCSNVAAAAVRYALRKMRNSEQAADKKRKRQAKLEEQKQAQQQQKGQTVDGSEDAQEAVEGSCQDLAFLVSLWDEYRALNISAPAALTRPLGPQKCQSPVLWTLSRGH